MIHVNDNGSTDGTLDWLNDNVDFWDAADHNTGVSKGWNEGLRVEFEHPFISPSDHVLVVNNDTILPRWFYRTLLSYDAPFVTGVAIDTMPTEEPGRMDLQPHPDFSAFLIRRECWEKVGPFDEEMVLYAGDTDYHVRAHQLGVPLMKANVPYYHVNSQTMKRASSEDRQWIQERANLDREVFKRKWRCLPGTPEYNNLFKEAHAQTSAE